MASAALLLLMLLAWVRGGSEEPATTTAEDRLPDARSRRPPPAPVTDAPPARAEAEPDGPAPAPLSGRDDIQWSAEVWLPAPCPGLCIPMAFDCRSVPVPVDDAGWEVHGMSPGCTLLALVITADGAAVTPWVELEPEDRDDAPIFELGPWAPWTASHPWAEALDGRDRSARRTCEQGRSPTEIAIGSCDDL